MCSRRRSWRSCPGRRHDDDRQRCLLRRGAARGPVPAHVPARARLVRRQERLRLRRLRRLHRASRRRARALLPDAGPARARARGDHHRGAGGARRAAPDAAGLPRRAGIPVRLLHGRHGDDLGLPRPGAAARPARRAEGKSLPMHRLPGDRRCDRRRRACRDRRTGRGDRPLPRRAGGADHRDRARPATRWMWRWMACCT